MLVSSDVRLKPYFGRLLNQNDAALCRLSVAKGAALSENEATDFAVQIAARWNAVADAYAALDCPWADDHDARDAAIEAHRLLEKALYGE